jgi:hypothetical protein
LSGKLRRRLAENEWFEDLLTLRSIDDRARRCGVEVCTVEEALAYLQEMGASDDAF